MSLIAVDEDQYLISWYDQTANAYGIDKVVSTDRCTSYTAFIDSPLYEAGTSLNKKTFTEAEIVLDRPLTTGQGVRLSYRLNLNDAFSSPFATFDFATHGGIISMTFAAPIADAQFLQIRAELTTGSSSTTTPHLKEIRLR